MDPDDTTVETTETDVITDTATQSPAEQPAPEAPAADDAEPGDDLYSDPVRAKEYVAKLRRETASHRADAKAAAERAAEYARLDAIPADQRRDVVAALSDLADPTRRTAAARWLTETIGPLSGAKRSVASLWEDVQEALDAAAEDADRVLTVAEAKEITLKTIADERAAAEAERSEAAERDTMMKIDQVLTAAGHARGPKGEPNFEALKILASVDAVDTSITDPIKRVEAAIVQYNEQANAYNKKISDDAIAAFLARKVEDANNSPTVPTVGNATVTGKPVGEMSKADRVAAVEALIAAGRAPLA